MTDSVYKEVATGAPIINLKYYKPTNPHGALIHPGRVRGGRVPLRPQHHPAPLHRPGRRHRHERHLLGAVSSVPLFEARAGDNNLNGPAPLPPRLKIQWSKFFNDPMAKKSRGSVPRTARPVRQFDASLAGPLFQLPPTALPDTQPAEPALAAEPPPGQEDGPALGTAGGSADGRDAAHQRPAVDRTTASR